MTTQPTTHAERMMTEAHFATDHTGKHIFVWDGTTYTEPTRYTNYARGHAANVFEAAGYEDGWGIPRAVETVREIRMACARDERVVTGVASGTDPDGRPIAVFANGHVDPLTGVLSPPSPSHLIASQWACAFDPCQPTPIYDQWVSDRGLTDQLSHLEAVLGSMFDATYRHPKMVVLTGTWEAGKTTLLNLITHIGNGAQTGLRHRYMVARFLCDMGDAVRDTGLDVQPCVTTNNNVSIKSHLSGKRGLSRSARIVTSYRNNALHVVETVGEGWGLPLHEARKWESNAEASGTFDLFRFMNPVPSRLAPRGDLTEYEATQRLKAGLCDEAAGIAARWLNAYRNSSLVEK